MADEDPRPTERHYRCPNCKVPRFLAAASRGIDGTLRIKCPKCRHESIFDLANGDVLASTPLRSQERELRCGGCTWFLAGVTVAVGAGYVRLQCPQSNCKRQTRFACTATTTQAVEVPVG